MKTEVIVVLAELYLNLCCTLIKIQGNLAFSPILQDANKLTFPLTSTRQYALKTKSNNKWDVSSTNLERDEPRTEVKRIRFILNQLRGDLQESEMRATAAERRVATLQKSLNETYTENERETLLDDDKQKFQAVKEENMKLKDKVNQLMASMDFSKKNTKKKIAMMEKERENERRRLDNTRIILEKKLHREKQNLKDSIKEYDQLHVAMDKTQRRLNHELQEMKLEADNEMGEVVSKFTRKIEDLKSSFTKEKITFLNEKEHLEMELSTVNKLSEKLEEDLKDTEREMTEQLMATKLSYARELKNVSNELKKSLMTLETQNKIVSQLEAERISIRKLSMLQLSILKQRIVKKIKWRGNTHK